MKKNIFIVVCLCIVFVSCGNTENNQDINQSGSNISNTPISDDVEYIVEGKKIVIEIGQCLSDEKLLMQNASFKAVLKDDVLTYQQYKKQNCTPRIYDPIVSRDGNDIIVDYAEIVDYTRCDCYRLFKVSLSGVEYGDYNVIIRDTKMTETTIDGEIRYDSDMKKDFIIYEDGKNKMGITGKNRDLEKKLESYINTTKKLKLIGIIYRGLPDVGGRQIEVSSIEEK